MTKLRHFSFLCLLLLILGCSAKPIGQTPENEELAAEPKVSFAEKREKLVVLHISRTQAFIVGGNEYILQIGQSQFRLSEQKTENSIYFIGFHIPNKKWSSLQDGDPIFLSYGEVNPEEREHAEGKYFWSLGNLDKSILQ